MKKALATIFISATLVGYGTVSPALAAPKPAPEYPNFCPITWIDVFCPQYLKPKR